MNKGYTLIEVVIALAIFAILGTLSVGLLSRAYDIQSRIDKSLTPLSDLELAVTRITEDAHQIVNRSVRDSYMNLLPAFSADGKQIAFTRGGFIPEKKSLNPSSLRRVALICENHKLMRATWPVLDGIDLEHPHLQVLMDDLISCQFSLLHEKKWIDKWIDNRDFPFPQAFKLHIQTKTFARTSFVFVIPGGQSDESKG